MPIDSNGSTLRVTTNVGGKTYEDESYRDAFYNRNQQQEVSHQFVEPLHSKKPKEAEVVNHAIASDKGLEKAISNDLSNRNIKSKTKTTTKTTKQTND